MKKNILLAASIMTLMSGVASAEIVNVRLKTQASMENEVLGASPGSIVYLDLKYDTVMPIEDSNQDYATYRDHNGSLELNVPESNISNFEITPSSFVSTSWYPSGMKTGYDFHFMTAINAVDANQMPVTGEVSFMVKGYSDNPAGLLDISTLQPQTDAGHGFGDAYLTLNGFSSNLEIQSIEKCPDSGCEAVVDNTKIYEISGTLNSDAPQYGLTSGDQLTLRMTYNQDVLELINSDSDYSHYEFQSSQVSVDLTAGDYQVTNSDDLYQTGVLFSGAWANPNGSYQANYHINIPSVVATDATGMVVGQGDAMITLDGTIQSYTAGEIINPSKLSVDYGDVWLNGLNISMSVNSVNEVSDGDCSGTSQKVTNTAPMTVEGQLQVFGSPSAPAGSIDMTLKHTGGQHIYFKYAVDVVMPNGFVWNLENGNTSTRIGLAQNTSSQLSVPFHLEPMWPVGEYIVLVKFMTDEGMIYTKEFSVTKQ